MRKRYMSELASVAHCILQSDCFGIVDIGLYLAA